MIKKITLEQIINCLELAFKLKNEAAVPAGVDPNSDPAGRRAMSVSIWWEDNKSWCKTRLSTSWIRINNAASLVD